MARNSIRPLFLIAVLATGVVTAADAALRAIAGAESAGADAATSSSRVCTACGNLPVSPGSFEGTRPQNLPPAKGGARGGTAP